MADRLEMHVLAVGQGSCGLVAHYDENDQLVQLDLCDCGRKGGDMTTDNLKSQMALIRGLMQQRATAARVTGLYLDNVIISHKDEDHLSLFTDRYLFEGCTPSPNAERRLDGNLKRRQRAVPPSALPQAVNGGEEDEDESGILLFESVYALPDNFHYLSVEYAWENRDEHNVLHSDLFYCQRYDTTRGFEGIVPSVKSPFHYDVSLAAGMELGNGEDFSLSLDASPEIGYVSWSVFGGVCCSRGGGTDKWSVRLSVIQENFDAAPSALLYITVASNPNTPKETIRSEKYKLKPPKKSVAFCWDMELLDGLYEFIDGNIQELYRSKFSGLVPKINPDWIAPSYQCLSLIWDVHPPAYRQMCEELPAMFKLLSQLDCRTIHRCLFGGLFAPSNSQPLTVGRIYLGGLKPSKSDIARDAVKKLSTFCPEDVQRVSGIANGGNEIRLIQMPLEWEFQEEENSRSLMYIASDKNGYRAVFPGDATGETMFYFCKDAIPVLDPNGNRFDGTWLCAPHHGSWETCSNFKHESKILARYLLKLKPSCVLVSAGFFNQYFHPRVEFSMRAAAALKILHRQLVAPHWLMMGDPACSRWEIMYTQIAMYSTVSVFDDDNTIYYANLSIQTGAKEVSVGKPVQLRPISPKDVFPMSDEFMELVRQVKDPRRNDAFPFLFDEPSAP